MRCHRDRRGQSTEVSPHPRKFPFPARVVFQGLREIRFIAMKSTELFKTSGKCSSRDSSLLWNFPPASSCWISKTSHGLHSADGGIHGSPLTSTTASCGPCAQGCVYFTHIFNCNDLPNLGYLRQEKAGCQISLFASSDYIRTLFLSF